MKLAQVTTRLGLALALFVVPTIASAQIRDSKHDLSVGSAAAVKSGQEEQICKFCHTPHKAQSTQFLWNHTPTAYNNWSWGSDLDGNPLTSTTQGTPLPLTLRAGSKRCLGCHDGSVAIGDVTNAGGAVPGPGTLAITDVIGRVVGGKMVQNGTADIGFSADMQGNHPVSIPYAGQTGYNALNSGVPASMIGSVLGGYYSVVAGGACTSPSGVCTSAPTALGVDGSVINLIPQLAGGVTNVGVECSSCHEPHRQFPLNTKFTRVTMVDSGLCRSCHNK